MSQATLNTYEYGTARTRQTARKVAREQYWSEHNRSSYSCPDCGAGENLEVHHKDGNPFNNSMSNLVGLCRRCHGRRHKRKNNRRRLKEWKNGLVSLGGD